MPHHPVFIALKLPRRGYDAHIKLLSVFLGKTPRNRCNQATGLNGLDSRKKIRDPELCPAPHPKPQENFVGKGLYRTLQ
jgi:hypothetical protein